MERKKNESSSFSPTEAKSKWKYIKHKKIDRIIAETKKEIEDFSNNFNKMTKQ